MSRRLDVNAKVSLQSVSLLGKRRGEYSGIGFEEGREANVSRGAVDSVGRDAVSLSAGFGVGTMQVDRSNIVGVSDVKFTQQSATSGGNWGPMDGASLIFLGDVAYLIGGWGGNSTNGDWPSGTTTNLVYKSSDFGITWEKIKDHDLTPDSTHFTPRHTFNSLLHTASGTDYIYIFGGDADDDNSAVHRTTDGVTWEQVAADGSPPWDGHVLTFAGTLGGVLFVCGGSTLPLETANHTNNVWKSVDDGVNWTLVGTAPWSARSTIDRMPLFDGKLWVIGGGVYDSTRVPTNDVWSFDGTTWTEVLAAGHNQWAGKMYPNVFAFDGWLYTAFGSAYNPSLVDHNEIYRTRDGANWFPVANDLLPSHAHGLGVHPVRGALIASGAGFNAIVGKSNTDSPTFLMEFK